MDVSGAKTATVNGTELAYLEQGSGEAVVFVHGAISDMRTWERQIPAVAKEFRAITYSRRYARPNKDLPPDTVDPWQQHVDDLIEFIHEIDAKPAHLVGNSQGALICMVAARSNPEAVKTLVLEEPAAPGVLGISVPPKPLELFRLSSQHPGLALTTAQLAWRVLRPMLAAVREGNPELGITTFSRGVLGDEVYDSLTRERQEQNFENGNTICAFAMNPDLPSFGLEDAANLKQPTLLVSGAISPKVLLGIVDRLAEAFPTAEHVRIPGASHFMHEEAPTAVNDAVLRFLRRGSSIA